MDVDILILATIPQVILEVEKVMDICINRTADLLRRSWA